MLKKLTKFGNSQALIIDRAILELLEIKENMPLRLKTDGKSLIITPEAAPVTEPLWLSGQEAMYEVFKHNLTMQFTSPEQKEKYERFMATPEFAEYQKKYQQIFAKYPGIFKELASNQAYLNVLEELAEKYRGNYIDSNYTKELFEARALIPGCREMDGEIKKLHKEIEEACNSI